jgi:2-polyprenyl-6-methoxyphenol hydroxylase-like FAD-dependent oxidoreductase
MPSKYQTSTIRLALGLGYKYAGSCGFRFQSRQPNIQKFFPSSQSIPSTTLSLTYSAFKSYTMSSNSAFPKDNDAPVLIAGAGLGGLCLAQALKKHAIPFKIFERDFKRDFRAQGYRLRISEGGIIGLQYALTPEVWSLFDKTSAEFLGAAHGGRFNVLTAEPLPAGGGPPAGAHGQMQPYTVDRTTMREVLLTNLESNIHYGKCVSRFETHDDRVTAYFSDGTSESGSLLVGADGLNSSIRRQLLPGYPFLDSGSRIIYGKSPITSALEAEIPANLLGGMVFLSEDTTHGVPKTMLLEAIRFPQGRSIEHIELPPDYFYWVLLLRKEHFSLPDTKLLSLSNEESADLALSLTEKWHPSIKAVVKHQDRTQTSTLRIASVDPKIPDWQPSERVTLLGDAIHAMPPTGGLGVNTALRDASDLARRITKARDNQEDLAGIVGEYERNLREYARKPLAMSWGAGGRTFGLRPADQCERLSP